MDFRFLEVDKNDTEMLEKVFAFRYKVISTTEMFKEYFENNKFDDNKEHDEYDEYSIHFIALDKNDEIAATLRLIHHCPHGYPTENCMKFDTDMFERDKLGELSRIFIDSNYRNIKIAKIMLYSLTKLAYSRMLKHNIEYTYGALEPRFIRLLKMSNMNYEIIGEKQLHGKMGLRYPCILNTKRLAKDNNHYISEMPSV